VLDAGDVAFGRLMRRDILVYTDKQLGPVDGDMNDANRVSLHTVDVMEAYRTWCWHVCAFSCMCSVFNKRRFSTSLWSVCWLQVIKLMKGKALRKHSLHEKTVGSTTAKPMLTLLIGYVLFVFALSLVNHSFEDIILSVPHSQHSFDSFVSFKKSLKTFFLSNTMDVIKYIIF